MGTEHDQLVVDTQPVTPGSGRRLGQVLAERRCRMACLVVVIVVLSLADLLLTLTYSTTCGMTEVNPVAQLFMAHGSVLGLVLWKFATVGLSAALFWRMRNHRTAELGAWLGVMVMTWLTCHWISYNAEVSGYTPAIQQLADTNDSRWVVMRNE